MLISCSVEVSDEVGHGNFKKSLPFFLASIAFPIDMKKILKKSRKSKPKSKGDLEAGADIVQNIEKALSNYSKKVLSDFVKMPEISTLLLNYLSKSNNPELGHHEKMMKDMAENSISEYQNSELDPSEKAEDRLVNLTS